MSSVDQQLCIEDCFNNFWVYRSGMYWSVSMIDYNNDKATICMSKLASVSCPGAAYEKHTIRFRPTAAYPKSVLFNNGTIQVTYRDTPSKECVIVNIADVEEEQEEPEETDVQTGRINDFSITGNSPYMVGSMINWQFTVEYLETTNLECQAFFGYTKNGQTSYVGPMASKGLSYEKGTRIHPKGALKISESMLGYNDHNLKIYFCIVDNNTGITQDIKFIPIEVIETTYPDDHPIWDDPDPTPDPDDPDVIPEFDDPDVIPEFDDNIWFYVTLILFVGLIGVMLWSSR